MLRASAFYKEDEPTTSLAMKVYIRKDPTLTARKIRDLILKDDFGFTDAEVADFNARFPNAIRIEDSGALGEWATDVRVRAWKPGPNGLIPITLDDGWVSKVEAFREQRASFEVFKVGMFIDDVEVRKQFSEDVEAILTSSGEKRTAALTNLMILLSGGGKSRGGLYKALRFLTNESGYRNNPFLLLAFAGATTFRSSEPSMGSTQVNWSDIEKAIAATNSNLYNQKPRGSLTNISSMEAAAINNWANVLYTNANNYNEASRRRWIERFLSMDDDERKTLQEGDIISIAPDEVSMRAPFQSETDRRRLDSNMQATRDQWAATDKIGAEQNIGMKSDHRQTEYYQRSTDVYPTGFRDTAPRNKTRTVVRVPDKFKSIYPNVLTDGIGAPFSLIQEGTKWYNFGVRMRVVTEYLAKRRRLDQQIARDNYRLVPPKPETIEEAIRELRKYGRLTRAANQKSQLVGVLSELEALKEESYAFYRTRK